MKDIQRYTEKALSSELADTVEGIDGLIEIVDKITDTAIQVLSTTSEHFLVTERMSMFFSKYINKLNSNLQSTDAELRFYSASLIVHYQISNDLAEQILLSEAAKGILDKAYTATIILCRVKNKNIGQIVKERLKDSSLTKMARDFFKDHLDSN